LPAVPETGGSWQCPRIPYAASRDFDVEYLVPSFSAGRPVQAVATYEGGREGSAVFVATRNRLHVLGPDLQPVESLATGPAGAPGCQTCAACGPGPHGPPGDTDAQVLVLEPVLPALISCGSSLRGRCFLHEIEPGGTALHLAPPVCLFSAHHNHPEDCPDCVASPLGTLVTVVEQGHASYFYVASSLDSAVAASFSPRSVSIRRLKADASGFAPGFAALSVVPEHLASYRIEYVYSFRAGAFVYFLTVQPANVVDAPGALHTRLARLSAVETDLADYRELVLDCRFAPKRRRRTAHEGAQPYPVLRAAHAAPVGGRLATELSIAEGQEVLFGVFSASRDSGPGVDPNSVVCAFPVDLLDTLIEQGVERCCEPPVHPGLRRGLDFFQLPSFCPDPPGLVAPSPKTSCRHFPLLVSSSLLRVDLFNGLLGPAQVTALHVTRLDNVTVAHMGTADGRILQVELARSLNYLLYVSNFSLGSNGQPVHRGVSRLGDHLLFASGDQFSPHSGPLRGSTRLTLCGSNFYLHPPGLVPEGTHQVTVGQSPCRLLLKGNSNLSQVPRKDFVEELECELEPLGTQEAGPANVSLTVNNMPLGKHFRVDGTSMLRGFSFMEPMLTAVQPLFGPRAGGTCLTLEGQGLSVGTSRAVLVNGTECLLKRVSEGQLLCTTPPGAATARVPIRLQVGGAEVPGSWNFYYQEDPIMLGISPNCGYTGSHVTIHGQHLTSVWHLVLSFHDGRRAVENRQCEGQLPEQHWCRLPEYVVRGPQGWYIGLGAVADCVDVNVTVGGESCQHELRGDVIVCPLPPSLQLGKDGAPLQVCVDDGCHILGKVVRPGLEGVPQSTLLGVLLALLLLVAVLATILVFSYHQRKQLVLSPNLDDLASLDRTTGAMPLPLLHSSSDYRNGLGEMVEVLEAGTILSAPPVPHSLSSSAAPAIDGRDSTTQVHRASFSGNGDGSHVILELFTMENTQMRPRIKST
ncbi:hypothetical protein E2I00_006489, partial [Balaenoptera physalus]